MANQLFITSDNRVLISGLQDQVDDSYVNDATISMTLYECSLRKNLDRSAATDEGGGLVGFPITAHGFATGDYFYLHGDSTYNGEYQVDASSTTNLVVATATYSAKTFNGKEIAAKAVANARGLALSYISASNGNYAGNIPDTVKLIDQDLYFIMVTITDTNGNVLTIRDTWQAVYDDG